jgi:hypothetical protein
MVPLELMGWKHYPANLANGTQEHVVLVTAGGMKIKHFHDGMIDEVRDPDTARQIRDRLRLYAVDKSSGDRVPMALPQDLTLSEEAVTGVVKAQDHIYAGGYLKGGGKAEAMKREHVRASRSAGSSSGVVQPIRRHRRY